MKIVFMGSAEFGIPALKLLLRNHAVVGIVTTPPRPKGRGRGLRHRRWLNSRGGGDRPDLLPRMT